MIPESIKKQWNVCRMPGCRCKDTRAPKKHGPYYQLSFTLAGKSTSMFIKDAEYEQMRSANDRYRIDRYSSSTIVHPAIKNPRF
jgi:hypothetical protein